jgi:hypothetical protein
MSTSAKESREATHRSPKICSRTVYVDQKKEKAALDGFCIGKVVQALAMNFGQTNQRLASVEPENKRTYYKPGGGMRRGGSDGYEKSNPAVPSASELQNENAYNGHDDADLTEGATDISTDDENVREYREHPMEHATYQETATYPATEAPESTAARQTKPKSARKHVPYVPWEEPIDSAKICVAVASQQNAKGVCSALAEGSKAYVTLAGNTLLEYQAFAKAADSRTLAVDVLKKLFIALQYQGKLEALLLLTESVTSPGIMDGRTIANRVLKRFKTPLAEVLREILGMLAQD